MKRRAILASVLAVVFLGLCGGLQAQTNLIQKNHCAGTTSCSYSAPVGVGHLLIVATRTSAPFIDLSGAKWTQFVFQGWYGAYDSLWYTAATAASVTVTFPDRVADISMLE